MRLLRPHSRYRWIGQVPAILMYHRIAEPEYDPWQLAVSAGRFEEQLIALKRECEMMLLDDFARLLASNRLPSNAVAITFDDGYACNWSNAAPLLHQHRIPATFFLTTGSIGTDREFWWDELAALAIETHAPVPARVTIREHQFLVPLDAPLVPKQELHSWKAIGKTKHPRLDAYQVLWAAMRPLSKLEQESILDSIWSTYGCARIARECYRALTLAEVYALQTSELFRIGAHTVTHPALGALLPSDQRFEIEESRATCARLASSVSSTFSYPYGDLTPATVDIVRNMGFLAACTTRQSSVVFRDDLFLLPRLQMTQESRL